MFRRTDLLASDAIVTGWIWAAAGIAFSLLLTAVAQGLGAMLGGCEWIGLTTPVDRPVWALVNQPKLDFATRTAAVGYWHAGWVASLGWAALAPIVWPRPRTASSELGLLHLAWACAAIGCGWLPLVGLGDGAPARWLILKQWPLELVGVLPMLGAAAGLAVTVRILSLARAARSQLSRAGRLAVVLVHQGAPTAVFLAAVWLVSGSLPPAATVGLGCVVVASLGVAWIGLPPAHAWPLEPIGGATAVRALVTAGLLLALVVVAGRPLSGDTVSAILWSTPSATNNIRPWVDPMTVLGASSTAPSAVPATPTSQPLPGPTGG